MSRSSLSSGFPAKVLYIFLLYLVPGTSVKSLNYEPYYAVLSSYSKSLLIQSNLDFIRIKQ
jgi:hypothetical protein